MNGLKTPTVSREGRSPGAGVRYLDTGKTRVGAYLMLWGTPQKRDLHGQFFTPETELGLDWFGARPLMYQHGYEPAVKAEPVGVIDALEPDDQGLWYEAQLKEGMAYEEAVRKLIAQGRFAMSSGAIPSPLYVDVTPQGEIKRWIFFEGSLTPTPAEPRLMATRFKAVGGGMIYYLNDGDAVQHAYKSLALPLPDGATFEADPGAETAPGIETGPVSAEAGEERAPNPVDEQAAANEAAAANPEEEAQQTVNPAAAETQPESPVQPAAQPPAAPAQQAPAAPDPIEPTYTPEREEPDMDPKTLQVEPDALRDAVAAALAAEREEQRLVEQAAKAQRADELEAQMKALAEENAALKQQTEKQASAPAYRLPASEAEAEAAAPGATPRIEVSSKFDNLSALDMLHGYQVLAAQKHFKGVSPQYANAMATALAREGIVTAKTGDELMHTTQTGYGDEWVPELWSSELWRQARMENVVLPLFRTVEMPSSTYDLPIEGSDPTVYHVSETTDESQMTLADGSAGAIPKSKFGTGKVTLNAKKLALLVPFSSELTEDSIVPIITMARMQAVRAMSDAIDSAILNGDTTSTATGNINSDDAAPDGDEHWTAFNGVRKLALVTNTANAVNAGGAPTLQLLRQTRFTLAHKYSVKPSNLAWIVDGATYGALLNIDEFMTMDKAGPQATAITGQIGYADGAPVLASAHMSLTEADGKVSATPVNNTLGQAAVVYRPGWVVGYRRNIAATVSYMPYYDAYVLTATVRIALTSIDNDVAGVLYNIAV